MRSNNELKEMSKHLSYELMMLHHTANFLSFRKHPVGTIEHNALLESFLIHARGLIEFLYGTNSRLDDCTARDFFSSPEKWEAIRPEISDLLEKTLKRAHKKLAHLTFERLSDLSGWKFSQIRTDIFLVFRAFFSAVDPDLLSEIRDNVQLIQTWSR